MKKRFFLSLLIACISANAQDLTSYNKLYTKTYLETAPKDFNKALSIADSLYKTSQTSYFQAKSLMLTASLYRQSGDVKKSVLYAERSALIVDGTDDSNWKCRIYLFLASQYRILELYNQSKKYSEKGLEISKTISDTLIAHNIQGMALQEMAYYEIDRKKYKKSIQYIQRSQAHFNNIKKDKDFFTSTNEQLLGLSYYHLKNIETSLFHYEKALNLVKDVPENQLTGYIYNGLANVYLEKNDLIKAKKYLDLAQKVADKAEHLELKKEVYSTVEQYYIKTKDIEKLKDLGLKKDTLDRKITSKTRQFIDESYTNLDKKIIKAEKKSTQKNYLIIITGLLVILVLALYIRSKIQQRKNIEKFKEILRRSNEKPKLAEPIVVKEVKIEDTDIESSEATVLMTSETEEKLLAKLNKFEKSNLFNNKNISLPFLAGRFETNTKYLSYVINTHKEKDFNNYINELRINYIIEKLKNEPQYRNYKMASLAEEIGFSSHSKFSKVFKKVTSLSPSLFIKYLQDETQNKKD